MILSEYRYVCVPARPDLLADVEALYVQNGREKNLQQPAAWPPAVRWRHGSAWTQRSASGLATSTMLPTSSGRRTCCAMPGPGLPLDAAEQRYPFLLHQRSGHYRRGVVRGNRRAGAVGGGPSHPLRRSPRVRQAFFLADKISGTRRNPPSLAGIERG